MTPKLQVSDLNKLQPKNVFLRLEEDLEKDPNETALEIALFDFNSTEYQIGARMVYIPPNRAFRKHVHPNAFHFIYVVEGTAVMEYAEETYTLKPNQCCLVEKGIEHKLGAGDEGVTAIVVNHPTYNHDDPRHIDYVDFLEEETLEVYEANYCQDISIGKNT